MLTLIVAAVNVLVLFINFALASTLHQLTVGAVARTSLAYTISGLIVLVAMILLFMADAAGRLPGGITPKRTAICILICQLVFLCILTLLMVAGDENKVDFHLDLERTAEVGTGSLRFWSEYKVPTLLGCSWDASKNWTVTHVDSAPTPIWRPSSGLAGAFQYGFPVTMRIEVECELALWLFFRASRVRPVRTMETLLRLHASDKAPEPDPDFGQRLIMPWGFIVADAFLLVFFLTQQVRRYCCQRT